MVDGTAGHRPGPPRPDTGARWLDLLATVSGAYGPAPRDRLSGVPALARWLADEGLTPRRAPTAPDLDRARGLREILRPWGLAAASGHPVPPRAVAALDAVLERDEPARLRLPDAAGRPRLVPPSTVDAALARVAREAATDLTGPRAARLRGCADHECGMLYLDVTGRRRWCSAAVCGVRHRVRAHRARTRPH